MVLWASNPTKQPPVDNDILPEKDCHYVKLPQIKDLVSQKDIFVNSSLKFTLYAAH